MDINVILFNDFTALDFIGPVEVLQSVEGYRIRYISLNGGLVSNDAGLTIRTEPFSAIAGGILLVPGGFGTRTAVNDAHFIDALREKALESEYCLTVCTGSALLAKTGLLDGRKATSNKIAFPWVKSVSENVLWQDVARWCVSEKYYTASGVSAGIDMALGFVADRFGTEKARGIARRIEYIWNEDPTCDPFAR